MRKVFSITHWQKVQIWQSSPANSLDGSESLFLIFQEETLERSYNYIDSYWQLLRNLRKIRALIKIKIDCAVKYISRRIIVAERLLLLSQREEDIDLFYFSLHCVGDFFPGEVETSERRWRRRGGINPTTEGKRKRKCAAIASVAEMKVWTKVRGSICHHQNAVGKPVYHYVRMLLVRGI